jgi:glycogenin glucosyltransferase
VREEAFCLAQPSIARRNDFPIVGPPHDYSQHSHSPSYSTYSHNLDRSEHAVVSSIYSDDYLPAIQTLGYSIKAANITARMILIYIPAQVSPRSLCLAEAAGWMLHPVPLIPPPRGGTGLGDYFKDQYTKLNIWKLDALGIRSIVYLDGDTLVRRNFDELFTLPFNFAAVGDVFDQDDRVGFRTSFNAGVLFLRPSTAIFHDMMAKMEIAKYPPTYAEQAFLNVYFGTQTARLPYVYNANFAIKMRSPGFWDALQDEVRIIHYTVDKPFPRVPLKPLEMKAFFAERKQIRNGLWRPEMEMWQAVWENASMANLGTSCG